MIGPTALRARAECPRPTGRLPLITPPPILRLGLGSGFEIAIAERREPPIVSFQTAFFAGALDDPAGFEGLATLTAALLRGGTRKRRDEQINELCENAGATLLTAADRDLAVVMVDCLSEDVDLAMELVLEVATAPAFDPAKVEAGRERRLRVIRQRRQNPSTHALADETFCQCIYGSTSYGRPELGTEDGLARISRDDVLMFHEAKYTARRGALLVAGCVDSETLLQRIEHEALPFEAAAAARPMTEETPPASARARVVVVDCATAKATELRLGHVGLADSHGDAVGLHLLATVLGGEPPSRLSRQLRERRGSAYDVRCFLSGRRGPGPLMISASLYTHRVGESLRCMLEELDRLRETEVEAEELEAARRALHVAHLRSFTDNHQLLIHLRQLALPGERGSTFADLPQRLSGLDAASLLELARRHFDPTSLTIVAVGPAEELIPQLAGIERLRAIERVCPSLGATNGRQRIT